MFDYTKVAENKDLIIGVAIGAMRKCGLDVIKYTEDGDIASFTEYSDDYEMVLNYQCGHDLEDLKMLETMLNQVCPVRRINIAYNAIYVYINKIK
jgi:hypothetical protein